MLRHSSRLSLLSLPARLRRAPLLAGVVGFAFSSGLTDAQASIRAQVHFDAGVLTGLSGPESARARASHRSAVTIADEAGLPVAVRLFSVPDGYEVSSVRIAPGPAARIAAGGLPAADSDKAQPAEAGFLPAWPGGLLSQGTMAGRSVQAVALRPLRATADPAELEFTSTFDVELELTPAAAPRSDLVRQRANPDADRLFHRALSVFVENPGDLAPPAFSARSAGGPFAPEELPSVNGSAVDMVIITATGLESEFQVLADWKTKKGVPTVVRTVDWIEANYPAGHDTPERIRAFLRDAYAKWGVYLALLAGDSAEVPIRTARCWFAYGGGDILTDQYYACLEGDWNGDGDALFGEGDYIGVPGDQADLLPELLVGRTPVETPAEAATFVAKSLAYEKSPPAGWVESFGILAEVLFPSDWLCGDPPGDIQLDGKTVAESLDVLVDPGWARSKRYQRDCDLDRSIALSELSFGHHLLAVVGHGDAFKFAVGGGASPFIYRTDVDTLTNAPRLSFVITVSCNMNQFDVECEGENFLHNPQGGAICVLSATRGDFPGSSGEVREEMLRLAFDQGFTRFGAMTQFMRVPFAPTAASDHTATAWTLHTTMLFGDPELAFWTREPAALVVSHPGSVPLDAGSIAVTVTDTLAAPLADVLVCASDANGTYSRGRTDGTGQVTLALGSVTSGTADVVVTHPEFVPYEGTVSITQPAAALVTLTDAVLDDDLGGASSGNGDGVVDAGETLEINLTALNAGGSTADSVVVSAAVEPGSEAAFDLLWDGARDPARVFVGSERLNPAAVPFTLDFASPLLDYHGAPPMTFAPDSAATPGIFVWQDREGWHLRWSGGPDSVLVSGQVTTDGRFRSAGSLELETGDGLTLVPTEDGLAFVGLAHGTDPADGFDFRLADSTMVSVAAGSDTVGTLAAAASGSGTVVVDVSTQARDGQVAYVDLTFTASSGGPWSAEVPLLFAGPELEAYLIAIDDSGVPPTSGDGDGVAEIGETVRLTPTVLNRGTGEAPGVNGSVSAATGITFVDASDAYGDLSSLVQSTGTDGYVFTIDDSTGTSLNLLLTDTRARSWAKTVSLVRPAPPANLVFQSDETSVTLSWDPNAEPNLAGYNVYRSLTGGGVNYSVLNFDLIRSGTRYVDTGLSLGSGFWYQVTAVDSSGNESVRSAELSAWTVQRQLEGWPQNAGNNVYASLALADADNSGQGEVYVGSIDWNFYGWEADGSTKPNFPIPCKNAIWGSPALADLDKDGDLEIVWAGRDTRCYVIHHDGTPAFGDSATFVHLANAEEIRSTASIADVDHDGELEFLFGTDKGGLYGFNHDGTGLTDSTGLLLRVTLATGLPRIWGPIAVADLDADGTREIVFGCWNDSLYVVTPDGSRVPGFPRAASHEFRGGAALGDLDADGTMEIVATNRDGNLYAYDHDGGDYLPGGILATLPDEMRGGVALANLDLDPELEVLVGVFDGHLYAFNHDGSGFLAPGGLFAAIDPNEAISATPIVVDVDGDGDFEIFMGHRNGNFYGFHHDGTLMQGFPVPTDLEIFSTASAGDLDGDGDVEIAFGSYDQTVNVLDFDGASTPAAYEWPTYAGNLHRTSVYGEPGPGQTSAELAAPPALRFTLLPGAPNPFREASKIRFTVPSPGPVRLQVFDVTGRLVRTLMSGPVQPGRHIVTWDGRDGDGRETAAGIYFYRLRGQGEERITKAVRLR